MLRFLPGPRRASRLAATLLVLGLLGTSYAEGESDPKNATHYGEFLDSTGTVQQFDRIYDSWFEERRGRPSYGLAALENAGVLAISLSYYWLNTELNRVDWDLPTVYDRFTLRAWRFDNNSNLFNHILHPLGGANYYGLARINNLSVLESALYANASSLIWEFGLEWRELVSVNDLIFTPVSGIAVGEFLFQLGEYLTSTSPTKPWHHVGAYTFGLYRSVLSPQDGNHRIQLPRDALGYSSAYWHRFDIEGQYVSITGSGQVQSLWGLNAEAQIIAMPGFARPGRFAKTFSAGNFSRGEASIALGSDGGFDTDLFFSANVYGRYQQDYAASPQDGQALGHARLLAVDTAFRFSDHSFSDRKDQVAIVHALGPTTRFWWRNRDLRTTLQLGATLDFAAIRSLAFEEWRKSNDELGAKSVLIATGYQYHWGASARANWEAQFRGFRLGLNASLGYYDSIEGLDRKQAEATNDLGGREAVVEYDGFLRIPIPATALGLRLSVYRFGRTSSYDSQKLRRQDTRLAAAIGATF